MDLSTRQILEREYPQVAYLSQSPNRDESAQRLLLLRMIIGCVHGRATDIGCQCLDFLQTGIQKWYSLRGTRHK
jgi:hypothetical protein